MTGPATESQKTSAGFKQIKLSDRYQTIRKYSEFICEPLMPEDHVIQPTAEVSPPKWHLAHTTWFFEEFVLVKYYSGYKHFHPRYTSLFSNAYHNTGERFFKNNLSRPATEEILVYRSYVDSHMQQLLPNASGTLTSLIELGLNHEQHHQELLYTDIKYILGHNPLYPEYLRDFKESPKSETDKNFIKLPEGIYLIGFHNNGFSYDNEHSAHKVLLKSFTIQKSLVTNGDYLKFVEAGGYQNPGCWLSDGWEWVIQNHIECPLYWHRDKNEWTRYSLSGIAPLDLTEPVTHISYYEAAAYAEWSGMRLPTEFEWEAASKYFNWGLRWEHTSSAYLPYPGYKKTLGVIGEYDGKFMVNNMVLRGASVVTPLSHSRSSYRNFFMPHLRWQFNGIRLCKNNKE